MKMTVPTRHVVGVGSSSSVDAQLGAITASKNEAVSDLLVVRSASLNPSLKCHAGQQHQSLSKKETGSIEPC